MARSTILLALGTSVLLLVSLVATALRMRSQPTVRNESHPALSPFVATELRPTDRVLLGNPTIQHASKRADGSERPCDADRSATIERVLAALHDLEKRVASLERGTAASPADDLESNDPARRRRGVRSLKDTARYDPVACRAIQETLGDDDPSVRIEAIEVLAEIGDRFAVPELCELLLDPEASVRSSTIDTLVELGAQDASVAIAARLADTDSGVRADAASALGVLGSPRSVGPLLVALHDVDADVRLVAVEALGKIGDRAAVPSLVDLYESGSGPTSMPFRVLEVLRDLGEPSLYERELSRLTRVALERNHEDDRCAAIRVLARYAPERSRDVVRRALSDPSARVRAAAARARHR